MPISSARAKTHIETWSPRCAYKYWPKYLFHHAHVSAIAASLKSESLVCRARQCDIIHDVANAGAIASNPEALQYVRLYFRPRTDFHLSTEGIKLRRDPYRIDPHMTIPVALLLDFESVVTKAGTGFSAGKLAHGGAKPGFDEAYFDSIQFSDVYHEGPVARVRRAEINDRRMAEVVVPGELMLRDHLKFILCRSSYDAATLRNFASGAAKELLDKIRITTSPNELFMCWGVFIKLLEYDDDAIRIQLYAGTKYVAGEPVHFKIEQLIDGRARYVAEFDRPITDKQIITRPFARDPDSLWRVHIEGALAFEGVLPYGRSQLVK